MRCRGIRGATTVDGNTREDTLAAAKELLREIIQANGVQEEEIACIFFTTTPDINSAFPAAAARELGLSQVPMLCGHEMNVPGSLPMCLRILILFNTEKGTDEIVHVYIKGARELRSTSDNQEGSLEV
jgi:chorismate mutase